MDNKETDALAEDIAERVSKKISIDHCPFAKPEGLVGSLRIIGLTGIYGTRAVIGALAVMFIIGAGSYAMGWVIESVVNILK
jgi:hypothetical protein